MENSQYTKWVACWGNAMSYTDRKEATYAKDLTLRYPLRMCFNGSALRFHFSNLTGTEPVTIKSCFAAKNKEEYEPVGITFDGGKDFVTIMPQQEVCSDEIKLNIKKGEIIDVSFYLENFTQLTSGVLITGPLSGGKFSYGNHTLKKDLPVNLTRKTDWYYFLETVDILTEEKNKALICYGDSITAQSWPDYLALRCIEQNFNNVSIIRRAVSGTRILREYDCITYLAYGLKGEKRFAREMNTCGAQAVIIQHGINDIIHPVGVEVNPFRPWTDMPSIQDLIDGVEKFYIDYAKKTGLKIYSGTLLPINGWRTYNQERETIRAGFNEWLRNCNDFDGCVDFDKAVRDSEDITKFAQGLDSGDHLHPSDKGYKAMANCVPERLL